MLELWKKIVDSKDYIAMMQFMDTFLADHADYFEKTLANSNPIVKEVVEVTGEVVKAWEEVSAAEDPNMAPTA